MILILFNVPDILYFFLLFIHKRVSILMHTLMILKGFKEYCRAPGKEDSVHVFRLVQSIRIRILGLLMEIH